MKTLKISETTHKELTDYIAHFYKKTNVKMTLNEAIESLLIFQNKIWEEAQKEAIKNGNK